MQILKNIPYSNDNDDMHNLDVYIPDGDSFPVVIYFHGGGIEEGDKECVFCPFLQEKGVALVMPNYRMYPSVHFPEFIEDAAESVAWAIKNMASYGNITGIYVGGSSAGAYIAEMLCFDERYLLKYGLNNNSIDGYIFDAGQPTVHFNVLKERGIDTRRVVIDDAAPLYHICEGRNYPMMNITVSDNDIPCRYEQTMLLIATLKNMGYGDRINFKLIENSTHCSYTDIVDEYGKNPLAEMIYEFIKG